MQAEPVCSMAKMATIVHRDFSMQIAVTGCALTPFKIRYRENWTLAASNSLYDSVPSQASIAVFSG